MKIIKADIWDYVEQGFITIPTNPIINSRGAVVMGRGLALQIKEAYPEFPFIFAKFIKDRGNVPGIFSNNLITFPVKYHWKAQADLLLIEQSAKILGKLMRFIGHNVYMPKVGCGNGQLDWEDVKPILEKYCPDVIIVDWS